MNNIYSTYDEYLENIDNDISEYLKKYDSTTEEDFYKELKKRYELFDFEKFTVKIQAFDKITGLTRVQVSVSTLGEIMLDLFNYDEYKFVYDPNLLPDDFFRQSYIYEYTIEYRAKVELGFDPAFDKKDFKTYMLIYDLEGDSYVFNNTKFNILEQTYKQIFAGRQIDSKSETQNEIDDSVEFVIDDKDEPISYGRFSVIESKTGKQLLSNVTGKTDLNQKQVLVLGRLIKDKMFRFAPPTDTRIALGLDVLFNFSHKNIRGKLNLNKRAKELKINLSDKEKAELKLLLEKMINDLNVKY